MLAGMVFHFGSFLMLVDLVLAFAETINLKLCLSFAEYLLQLLQLQV